LIDILEVYLDPSYPFISIGKHPYGKTDAFFLSGAVLTGATGGSVFPVEGFPVSLLIPYRGLEFDIVSKGQHIRDRFKGRKGD